MSSPSSSRLPEGWTSAKDSVSGREYFVNLQTKETRWDFPPSQASSAPAAALDDDAATSNNVAKDMAQVTLHDHNHDSDDRKMNDSTMPPPRVVSTPHSQSAGASTDPPTVVPAPAAATATATTTTTTTTNTAKKPSSTMPAPPPRNKKRFGLGDWNVLLRTANDLALRLGAPLRKIRWKEIRQHTTKYDGWVVIRNKVFFITPYLAYHPGGEAILVKCLGKDATALYDKYHQWVNLEALIGKLQIGYLDTSRSDDDDDDSDEEDDTAGLSLPDHLALSRR